MRSYNDKQCIASIAEAVRKLAFHQQTDGENVTQVDPPEGSSEHLTKLMHLPFEMS